MLGLIMKIWIKNIFRGFSLFFSISLGIATFILPASIVQASIELEYSHRVVPSGRTPDPEVVNLEGGIWATFTGTMPMQLATPDTSLHQTSDRVFKYFFPWDRTEPYEAVFIEENNDTTTVIALPQPIFPFDYSAHGVSVINLHTDPENLWSPATGLYVWGESINFDQRGSEWERPCTMDFFNSQGELQFSEPIGLRINGQFSRYKGQKGLRVYFDDYGNSDELDFDFFDSGPTSFRRILLRDNLTPYDWIKSNLVESIFRDLGHLGSRYSLAHTYLNDEYWGTYSIRDRIDDEFFEHTLGWDDTDYILLKDGETEHGDGQLWFDFLDSFGDEAEYESHEWFVQVDNQLDLKTFIDWLFLNIFACSYDNGFDRNVFIFREEGGKWTHLMWDEDATFRLDNLNSNHFRFYSAEDQAEFEEFLPPTSYWEWSERYQKYCTMFNRMMRNSEFKDLFSRRVDELLAGPMAVEGIVNSLNGLTYSQQPEIDLHSERWGWWSPQYYENVANNLVSWVENRHPVVVSQKLEFMDHFRAPVELTKFDIEISSHSSRITWTTESEDNCLGYILYRGIGSSEEMISVSSYETNSNLVSQGGIWQTAEYSFVDEGAGQVLPLYYQLARVESSGIEIFLPWILAVEPVSPVPALRINEFVALNSNGIQDESGAFEDWAEIFNAGTVPVSLEGMYLTDNLFETTKWEFPAEILEPGDFLLIWCDSDTEEGPFHASFKLSGSGEAIGLFDTGDENNRLIDSYVFGVQTEDVSEGRTPDGASMWVSFDSPTPGLPNLIVSATPSGIPGPFIFGPNYPNPFNPSTTINLSLQQSDVVSINVFDLNGRKIRTLVSFQSMSAGSHNIVWNGCDDLGQTVASGTYFARASTFDWQNTLKLSLVK